MSALSHFLTPQETPSVKLRRTEFGKFTPCAVLLIAEFGVIYKEEATTKISSRHTLNVLTIFSYALR